MPVASLNQPLAAQQTRRPPATAVLVICCLLSIISMTAWVREGESGALHRLRDATAVATAPLQAFGSAITSPLRALGNLLDSNSLSASEIDALRDENDYLRSEVMRLREYEQEARTLSLLLGIVDAYGLDMVGARVINRTNDPWNRTITINKGTNAGVRIYMPVMSTTGLIGMVESAGPTSSVVRLISDQRSSVPVFLQSNRAEGIMEGSTDGTLYLRYIGLDVEVVPGDMVVTSGGGGVFPKGIPVGTVQSVNFLPSDVGQTIIIRPLVRANSYEDVLVIIGSESEIQPPSLEEGPEEGDDGAGGPQGGYAGLALPGGVGAGYCGGLALGGGARAAVLAAGGDEDREPSPVLMGMAGRLSTLSRLRRGR